MDMIDTLYNPPLPLPPNLFFNLLPSFHKYSYTMNLGTQMVNNIIEHLIWTFIEDNIIPQYVLTFVSWVTMTYSCSYIQCNIRTLLFFNNIKITLSMYSNSIIVAVIICEPCIGYTLSSKSWMVYLLWALTDYYSIGDRCYCRGG